MKKAIEFEQGNKKYTLMFSIRSLAGMERSLGRSILYLLASGIKGIVNQANIDFTAAGIKHGLQELGDKDPYDWIDEFCEAGGTLDEINGHIIEAITASGLFTKGTTPEVPNPQTSADEK